MEPVNSITFNFDLGTFEGFNFRCQSAIEKNLNAVEVASWDHDLNGEAEFWPSGNHSLVAALFEGNTVTGRDLLTVDRLLSELGGDVSENFLKIYYAFRVSGDDLQEMSAEKVEDYNVHIFLGMNFTDVRQQAAYELFELYYPEAYAIWEKCSCDGLIFDTDRFLDSPSLTTCELRLSDSVALLVKPE